MCVFRLLALCGVALVSACMSAETPVSDVQETTSDDAALEKEFVDLRVNLPPPEAGYQLTTQPSLVPAGEEVQICSVVRVERQGDDKLIWVNEMESLISENSHHMNVLFGAFSFYDAFLGENAFEAELGLGIGTYDCEEVDALMEKALPIFPSQRTNQRITFPEGVAVPMMAPLVLIFHHHYINPTDTDVMINAALNINGIDEDEVVDVGYLIFDGDEELNIPGTSQMTEAQTCVMHREVNIALVSTHNHEKGDCATLNTYGAETGEISDTPFYVNKFWEAPPILHFPRGEFKVAAGDGIHYACHYQNPEDRELNFGPSESDEMCVFAAVAYPAPQSKEDVKSAVNSENLNEILKLSNAMITKCDEKLESQSPWPLAGKPRFGDFEGTCEGYTQTESNTLW